MSAWDLAVSLIEISLIPLQTAALHRNVSLACKAKVKPLFTQQTEIGLFSKSFLML